MDFPQQLEACVKQANQALSRFIAPLPFQNTPVVETMQYGALLGGKRLVGLLNAGFELLRKVHYSLSGVKGVREASSLSDSRICTRCSACCNLACP